MILKSIGLECMVFSQLFRAFWCVIGIKWGGERRVFFFIRDAFFYYFF